jgi:hypothetical protein
MIDNAISYYKIKNGYTSNEMSKVKDILIKMYNRYYNAHYRGMVPPALRKDPDPDHSNFKYRLENFVMKDLDIVKSDIGTV